jgi:diguanylate cyclase (GGDEF)-like protein
MTAQAGRQLSCLSIVVLDVDHLGHLNETLGRVSGDRAIAAVATTAGGLLRASDLAGRVDGGELVLVLPDTHKDGAIEVAERLRLGIAQLEVDGLDWPLSASFGVASFPDDAVAPADVLRLARAACQAAKAAGRNGVEAAGTWGLDLDGRSDALG